MTSVAPFIKRPLSRRSCAGNDEPGHDRRPRESSGYWTCSLTTLTPLCIQSSFNRLTDESPAVLPGSSLRGMVRNVCEVLGAGCAWSYEGGPAPPTNLSRCVESSACLTCRIFGFVDGTFAWAGKVRFLDTAPVRATWTLLSVPVNRPPQEDPRGWVVFRHGEPELGPGPTRCLERHQQFRFLVDYTNLDPEELALFRFALTLAHEPSGIDLCHKLGYAKALGLGSCKIAIMPGKIPVPPIGREIEPYLTGPACEVLKDARRYR